MNLSSSILKSVSSELRTGRLHVRGLTFSLSEKHQNFRKKCFEFAESELKPLAPTIDKEHRYPREHLKKLGDLGLLGTMTPKQYGGADMDCLAYAILIEEVSRGCASTGTIASVQEGLYQSPVAVYGNDAQKQDFLPRFASGDAIGSFSLSEPGNGSDAGSITTSATQVDGGYSINGTKAWVISGHESDAALVFAVTDSSKKHKGISAFIVPKPKEGLTLGKKDDKLGIKGCTTCKFHFENCFVPQENMLGKPGMGFQIAMQSLDTSRIGAAGQSVGIAQAAFECAIQYAGKRMAFGNPITKLPSIQNKLADMAVAIENSRNLVYKAAVTKDRGQPFAKLSAMAKLYSSQTATRVTSEAIQILGGMGYVTDLPAERYFRDARITEIYEGTSEIQKLIIANHLVKEHCNP